jgi:hypothetical protein
VIFLLLYFAAGLLASIYVCLRSDGLRMKRAEAIVAIVILLAAWPIVLTSPYWIFLGSEIREFFRGPWGRK